MKRFLRILQVAAILGLSAACVPVLPAPEPQKPQSSPPIVMRERPVVTRGAIPAATPVVKIGLLLPLSGESQGVGSAMLDAATMALYDSYVSLPSQQVRAQVILLPKDTGTTPGAASQAAQQVIDQDAGFILGPLFSQSVSSVAAAARAKQLSMLTFSNNLNIAGQGVYVFGFLPEQQVARLSDYAFLHKIERIAVLAPNDSYGQKIKEALSQSFAKKGGLLAPVELYSSSPANIDAAVSRLATAYANATEERRFQGIFIAEGGQALSYILNSLSKHEIDMKKVRLLGTGQWDDPEILKKPEMAGAWFASSPPEAAQSFEKRFAAMFGYKPARLASLAYDAVTLATALALSSSSATPGISDAALTDVRGFTSPANGLVRFRLDGVSERALAVLEITPGGFKVIDQAQKSF